SRRLRCPVAVRRSAARIVPRPWRRAGESKARTNAASACKVSVLEAPAYTKIQRRARPWLGCNCGGGGAHEKGPRRRRTGQGGQASAVEAKACVGWMGYEPCARGGDLSIVVDLLLHALEAGIDLVAEGIDHADHGLDVGRKLGPHLVEAV